MPNDIEIHLHEKEISSEQGLHGTIIIKYEERFDSVVINSQIENSNDIFRYILINGRKINHPYARIPLFKEDIGDKKEIEFIAVTSHIPVSDSSTGKFRTSIIQENKEIASALAYVKIIK
jgi:hypothetical protein